MKNLLILPLLFVLSLPAAAQWVTIPDANFANKLNELFPECMDENQMDTTCASIINEDYLNVAGEYSWAEESDISDFTGIQYFVNLLELNCSNNDLTFLPPLPESLTILNCRSNIITALPELPVTLTHLDCNSNNITELPELPQSLLEMDCSSNSLTSLPELPSSLSYLNCGYATLTFLPELPQSLSELDCKVNNITELPEFPLALTNLNCAWNELTTLPDLPQSLMDLVCNGNNLIELPELPQSLVELYCPDNSLTLLPDLPQSLQEIYCQDNNLTSLPELPQALTKLWCHTNNLTVLPELPQTLTSMHCGENNLTSLPALPQSLTMLHCFDNNLTSLPELPQSLNRLYCQSNQLSCLPTLPMSLMYATYFNISDNLFTCLPNYVSAMSGENAEWLSYPLCDLVDLEGNPYGCTSFTGIGGTVYKDDNGNCEEEESESSVINATIKLLDEEGVLLVASSTFGDGENAFFNFVADTGNYTVQLATENLPFQLSCDNPGDAQDVELTTEEPSSLNVDFGVECLPGFDIGVQAVTTTGWVFPGEVHSLKISAGDMTNWYGLQCAEDISGTVTVSVDGPVSYVAPEIDALIPTVTGELQFTYDIADFSDVNFQQDFALLFETNTTVLGEELVCVDILIDPIDGDLNPANNTYNYCYEVVNSYDPNIKQVWPQNVEPGYDGYFNYTIYFQNTGTAPAFNIRVADTLDTNLDLNTFEVTAYSHPCLTYVSGNVATFRFNNIMLPDSTSDFDGSIGYVQYRIKPIADLPVGTIIENTAHIYFDFNEAIVTNTTENEFIITTSVAEQSSQHVQVFPNPGTGLYNVSLHSSATGISMMEVFTLSGVRVLEQSLSNRQTTLDLTNQPPGMYLLRLQNELGSQVVKIVKH